MATRTDVAKPRRNAMVLIIRFLRPNAQAQRRRQTCASKFGDVRWSALLGLRIDTGLYQKICYRIQQNAR